LVHPIACEQALSQALASLKDTKLIVATSGGGDSQALLHALALFRPDIELVAVYCHHGLRPEDRCAQDIEAVKQLCQRHGVSWVVRRIPVRAHAKRHRMGIEESGRQWRYAMLAHLAKRRGATSVVTAHHLNDAAETALWQFIRGTRTLSAMKKPRWLGTIGLQRPLRLLPQATLQAFAKHHGVPVSVDQTNQDTRYTRNHIRHAVMPVLHTLNTHAAVHMVSFADYVTDLHDALDELFPTETYVRPYPQGVHIQARVWALPRVIRYRLLRHAMVQLGIDPHPEWVSQLEAAPQRQGSTPWVKGWSRTVSTDGVWLYPTQPPSLVATTLSLCPPQKLIWGGWHIDVTQTPDPTTEWSIKLDASVYETLRVETRRPGMMIHPIGYDQPISLQAFLVAQRVPKHLRESLPLFFDGDQLVWGPMLRRSVHVSCQSSEPRWVYLLVSLGSCVSMG